METQVQLMSLPEASKRLAVSVATLRRMITRSQICVTRIGVRVLVSEAEIARLVQEGTQKKAA